MLLLVVLTVLNPLLAFRNNIVGLRIALAVLFAVALVLLVYPPFVLLLYAIVSDQYTCPRIRPAYLLYLLASLQLVQAHIYFALFLYDETGSFTNVCSVRTLPADCTYEQSFLVMARLFYYSSVTFVSVGYGEIVPISLLASLLVLPQLWSPIFYLGILLGRIVDGQGTTAVQ